MQLTTRSTTCHNSRIVCWDANHTFFTPMLANVLLPVLQRGARVEEYSVLQAKSASECCRISVRSKVDSTLFPSSEQLLILSVEVQLSLWLLLFQECHSFFDHSGIVPCLDSRKVFPGWEHFLHKWRCCPFQQHRIVINRVSAKRIDSPLH